MWEKSREKKGKKYIYLTTTISYRRGDRVGGGGVSSLFDSPPSLKKMFYSRMMYIRTPGICIGITFRRRRWKKWERIYSLFFPSFSLLPPCLSSFSIFKFKRKGEKMESARADQKESWVSERTRDELKNRREEEEKETKKLCVCIYTEKKSNERFRSCWFIYVWFGRMLLRRFNSLSLASRATIH